MEYKVLKKININNEYKSISGYTIETTNKETYTKNIINNHFDKKYNEKLTDEELMMIFEQNTIDLKEKAIINMILEEEYNDDIFKILNILNKFQIDISKISTFKNI